MSSLKPVDRMYLEKLLGMEGGYVLWFSDTTFRDFVRGSTGEDIDSAPYAANGQSKAKRLRAFWDHAPNEKVAALLGDLVTLLIDNEKVESEGSEADRVRAIVVELRGSTSSSVLRSRASESRSRTAFISYSVHKKEAGATVKQCLSAYGYEFFLAHEDLRVSEEWKHRILEELARVDILVAVLSMEFKESDWCGQEIGFIVSRPEVLVIPLSIDGTMPYGFIDHLQGIRVNRKNLRAVLQEVLSRKRPR